MIDNSLSEGTASSPNFIDVLPEGMVIANPANTVVDGVAFGTLGTLTAQPGTDFISFSGFSISASQTATISVDVVGRSPGELGNTSRELTTAGVASEVSSGSAAAVLEVTQPAELHAVLSFTDDPVPLGGEVNAEIIFTNADRDFAATNIDFSVDLGAVIAGIGAVGLPVSNALGAGSSLDLSGGELTLTGGILSPGASETINVTLQIPTTAAPGAFSFETSSLTADIDGETITADPVIDTLFVTAAPVLEAEFQDDPIGSGGTTTLEFTLTNTSTTAAATDIAFTANLDQFISGTVLSANSSNGFNTPPTISTFTNVGELNLDVFGGALLAGASGTISVDLTIPANAAPGPFTLTTSDITATVNEQAESGRAASDDLQVVAGPDLQILFTDPVLPGDATTLQFTLDNSGEESVDATDIQFTLDLNAVIAGLTAVGLPSNDIVGNGSQISGTNLLTFTGGTLDAGDSETFDVTVQLPANAPPGSHTATTSDITATAEGVAVIGAPTSDALDVVVLTFEHEFTDPVVAGQTTQLTYTFENLSPDDTATSILFVHDLDDVLAGLQATNLPITNIPGLGSSSQITQSASNVLTFQNGTLGPEETAFFVIDVTIPSNAAPSGYGSATSEVEFTFDSTLVTNPASVSSLQVIDAISASKTFLPDTVAPGDTTVIEYTITNNLPDFSLSEIQFEDDLDAVISGLSAVGLPQNNVCGAGSMLTASPLTLTGGSLPNGGQCTFSVTASVPSAAAPNLYTSATSEFSAELDGLEVSGNPASDDLEVIELLDFSKVFDGPTTATGTPVLTFTITNPREDAVSDLSFSDNLEDVISGLAATNLPLNDVCGSGSLLSGASFLTLTDANLPENGGTCSFDVELLVPTTATAGTFTNTTSDLSQFGLQVGEPATADLTIEPPPTFAKVFASDTINAGGVSTLTFTIDNSASDLAASSLDFTDNLPAGIVIATPSVTVNTCGGTLTASAGAGVISLSGATVAAGSTCAIDVDVTSITVGMHVNTSGDLTSSSGNSGTATDTLTVNPAADISVTKSDDVTEAVPGEAVTYTIVVANAGPSTDPAVTLNDTFPGVLSATYTSVAAGGATGNTAAGADDLAETLSMPAGSSVTYTVVVLIDSATTGTLSNTATVAASITELDSSNNSATDDDTELTPRADLSITKMDDVDPVIVGDDLTYTITVTNDGPSDATGVVATDTLPAGVTLLSTSGCAEDPNGVATCSLGTIAAGGMATYTVTVNVNQDTPGGIITNTASVSSATTEDNPGDEMTTEDTLVLALDYGDAPDNGTLGIGLGSGSISGTKLEDVDADGMGDIPLTGLIDEGGASIGVVIELFLDIDGDGSFEPDGDDGSPVLTTQTDSGIEGDGSYSFTGLPAATYFVREQAASLAELGMIQTGGGDDFTGGVRYYTIALTPAALTSTGHNFANYISALISGVKTEDAAGDGFVGDDPPLANVRIELFADVNEDSNFEPGGDDGAPITAQLTTSNGEYSFLGLLPGKYFVREIAGDLLQTAGGDDFGGGIDFYTVSITSSGQVESGKNFANRDTSGDGRGGGGGTGGGIATIDDFEPNDSIGDAEDTELNGSGLAGLTSTIGDGTFGATSGDYDFFKVTADAGDTITAVTRAADVSGLDTVLGLYDMAGTLLASNDDTGGSADSELTFVVEAAGMYFVVVLGAGSGFAADPNTAGTGGGTGSTGNYNLSIEVLDGGGNGSGGTVLSSAKFPTLLSSDGARHVLVENGPVLGTAVDEEVDGQPSVGADGDDLNGATPDDENGVIFTSVLIPGAMADVQVTVTGDGLLNAWVDFNNDLTWHATEQVFTNHALTTGTHSLSFAVPTTFNSADLETIYTRFRYSTQADLEPNGLASDGEVEDHLVAIAEFDWADAPDASPSAGEGGGSSIYPTLSTNNGAHHAIIPGGIRLGATIDADDDGQPDDFASGDDLDSDGDDEDGVFFTTPLISGGTAGVDVVVSYDAGASGTAHSFVLNAWVDFDGDGSWDDAGEQIFDNEPLSGGTNPLTFTVPAEIVEGLTYTRFRLSTETGLSFDGMALDGEVEDYIVLLGEADFGDAPDPVLSNAGEYPTLLTNDGPFHLLGSDLTLGATVDAESDGMPNLAATGDDADNLPDEDGAILLSTLVVAAVDTTASAVVEASAAGMLDAWIDFNQNGVFDSSEHLGGGTSVPLVAGPNLVNFTVPSTAVTGARAGLNPGETYARLRLSSGGGLSPAGPADDGEVEDYLVTLVDGDGAAAAIVDLHPVVGDVNVKQDGDDIVVEQDGGLVLFQAPAASIATLEINGIPAAETFNVLSTPSGVATTINADDSNDTINVGDGSLDAIQGSLVVNGQGHDTSPTTTVKDNALATGDVLNIHDQAETSGKTYNVTATQIMRGGAATITYNTIETLNINVGTGADTINVTAAPSVNTTVNGSDGADVISLLGSGSSSNVVLNGEGDDDTISVHATGAGSATQINGGGGNDTINIGDPAGGTLDDISGAICVDGGGHEAASRDLRPGSGSVTPSNPFDETSAYVEDAAVQVPQGDTLNVNDTTNSSDVRYDLATGSVGQQTLQRHQQPFLEAIGIELTDFTGGSGVEAMIVDLSASGWQGRPEVFVFDGQAGDDILKINGSSADDDILVADEATDPGPRASFEVSDYLFAHIEGAGGNDTIVNDATGLLSLLAGNDGDDVLVGSDNVDLLFGGPGVDALFGNEGDDFLFADLSLDGTLTVENSELLNGGPGTDKGLGVSDGFDQDIFVDVETILQETHGWQFYYWPVVNVNLPTADEIADCRDEALDTLISLGGTEDWPSADGLELIAVDQRHGLTSDGNMYENWGGLGEKWLQGTDGKWYYITPAGGLYEWLGGVPSNAVLVAQPGSEYHANPELLYDAAETSNVLPSDGGNSGDGSLTLAEELDEQYGLYFDGNSYENWGGLNEKWMRGSGDHWFYITPDGKLYQWHGDAVSNATLVGELDSSYHATPGLLYDATATSGSNNGGEGGSTGGGNTSNTDPAAIDQELGLYKPDDYYTNWGGRGEKWLQGSGDRWYFITPDGGLYHWLSGDLSNSTLLYSLTSAYHANPALLYDAYTSATGGGSGTGSATPTAAELDEQLQLFSTGDYHDNWGGWGDRWLQGAGNKWYFILVDGSFYEWHGGSIDNSTLLYTLDPNYHTNPGLLHDAF